MVRDISFGPTRTQPSFSRGRSPPGPRSEFAHSPRDRAPAARRRGRACWAAPRPTSATATPLPTRRSRSLPLASRSGLAQPARGPRPLRRARWLRRTTKAAPTGRPVRPLALPHTHGDGRRCARRPARSPAWCDHARCQHRGRSRSGLRGWRHRPRAPRCPTCRHRCCRSRTVPTPGCCSAHRRRARCGSARRARRCPCGWIRGRRRSRPPRCRDRSRPRHR